MQARTEPTSPAGGAVRSPAGRSFEADQDLLIDVLREAIRDADGDAALDLVDRSVDLARAARAAEPDAPRRLSELAADLDAEGISLLARSLTRWFELHNVAEDNERVRRIVSHEVRDEPAPRAGSVRDAIERLAAAGTTADGLRAHLARAEVRLVVTAHPTEARRRTVIEKLARVFAAVRDLDRGAIPQSRYRRSRAELLAIVQELWETDELRPVSPSVLDEVQGGLVYFLTTLAEQVPVVYREIEDAVADAYPGEEIAVPPLLSFGSWIGGDRDGNPNVTPEVTAEALMLMREACLRFLIGRLGDLGGRLSLSRRDIAGVPHLDALIARCEERYPEVAAAAPRTSPEEPFRRAISLLGARLSATLAGAEGAYPSSTDLLADLAVVADSLREGSATLVAGGEIRDLIRQVEVFGFHFARLDIRENASRHEAAIAEVLAELGIEGDYSGLGAWDRMEVLRGEIHSRRPLVPSDISGFSEETQSTLRLFRTLKDLHDHGHAEALQAYVISNAEDPTDLLEVELLMKEAGLTSAGGEGAVMRIVPLFESGATLAAAPETMGQALDEPVYREALRASGDVQEVMVGYSDSNKDVGYLASSWEVYRAQTGMAREIAARDAGWIFFHGRGGAVGRGGGPTNVAIAALPAGTVGGRLKMTEQGEVLASKYAVGEIAHRELELTTSAVLFSTIAEGDGPSGETLAGYEGKLGRMSETAGAAYRALVHDDPGFVEFFQVATPIDEISRLQLGSRPARRKPGGGIDQLRAIPWVFSWTQSRIILPAWFGLGSALERERELDGDEPLREMAQHWPFFAAVLSNAEMACAKADEGIGRRYAELWDDEEPRERIWAAIATELERTRSELIAILGGKRLLDREPVLQASIDRRNPYVDPLSYVQVEVLRRVRAGQDLERESMLTINGIAGGLRNTG